MGTVDILSLFISHGLLALAAWRLVQRDALDADPAPEPTPSAEPSGDA